MYTIKSHFELSFYKFFIRIFFGLIPIKKYRKKYRGYLLESLCVNYLIKYTAAINQKNITVNTKEKNQDTNNIYIWQLWLQGVENAPPLVKNCYKSVDKYCSKNFKIIRLDEISVFNYIDIPRYILDKYKKKLFLMLIFLMS